MIVVLLLVLKTDAAGVEAHTEGSVGEGTLKPHYMKSTFCVKNHLIPSFFVIGIQKCGTSTLAGILNQFDGISFGKFKEHHFFDKETMDFRNYYHQFPLCEDAYRTFDATPYYASISDTNSANNIKAFYDYLGIPLEVVDFIAIVCPNTERLP